MNNAQEILATKVHDTELEMDMFDVELLERYEVSSHLEDEYTSLHLLNDGSCLALGDSVYETTWR